MKSRVFHSTHKPPGWSFYKHHSTLSLTGDWYSELFVQGLRPGLISYFSCNVWMAVSALKYHVFRDPNWFQWRILSDLNLAKTYIDLYWSWNPLKILWETWLPPEGGPANVLSPSPMIANVSGFCTPGMGCPSIELYQRIYIYISSIVGGFNPFEKHARQNGFNLPQFCGVNSL